MDKQKQPIPQIKSGLYSPVEIHLGQSTSLQELAFLCQNDDWFMNFIQDTEANQMLSAPPQMDTALLVKAEKQQRSGRIQLICYSMRVSLAATGAILMLFIAPVFLKQPLFKTTPPAPEKSAPHADQYFGTSPRKDMERKLKTGLWKLSDSIYDFSNELLEGGNQHD